MKPEDDNDDLNWTDWIISVMIVIGLILFASTVFAGALGGAL